MVIEKPNKVIFVHIPRTGGTSIEKAICDHLHFNDKKKGRAWAVGSAKHATLEQISNRLKKDFKHYYKFSFVRNPFDRIVSYWQYEYPDLDFDQVLFNITKKDKRFRRQQTFYLEKTKLDFVGRFENLQPDFQHVCKKLGWGKLKIPRLERTSHLHYSHYYNKNRIMRVEDLFSEDLSYFNYQFEPKG